MKTTERIHFWSYILNEAGEPLKNVPVTIFLSGTGTEANIFLVPSGGAFTTSTASALQSDDDGFFEVWIGNLWEVGGYDHTQLFKLQWYGVGLFLGEIEYINPWPNAFKFDLNLTETLSDSRKKNKFISNYFNRRIHDHLYIPIPSGAILDSNHAHGLKPVDRTQTDSLYNKVVSNKLLGDIYTKILGFTTIIFSGLVEEFEEEFTPSPSGGIHYRDVIHNLVRNQVSLQVSKEKFYVMPYQIRRLDEYSTRVFLSETGDYRVNAQAESSSSSSSSS